MMVLQGAARDPFAVHDFEDELLTLDVVRGSVDVHPAAPHSYPLSLLHSRLGCCRRRCRCSLS
jgi:hypothetical protein